MDWRSLVPRPFALLASLLLIAGAIVALEQPWSPRSRVPAPPPDIPADLLQLPAAADFGGATGWLQSEPLELVALRGQVVLVDFWTYSCINCIRTFPHVEGWYERYKDHGLVVVGVHSPEFRFERDAANVEAAAERYGITYPIAQDNDYRVWEAYHNRFWPAKYLVDPWGRIRYTHFGEGAYEETELRIRELLVEAGRDPGPGLVEPLGAAPPLAAGLTPELYAAAAQGSARVAIGNPEGYHPGEVVTYARPAEVARDRIFLAGTWLNGEQNVTAQGEAAVLVRFRAGGANFVADGAAGHCVVVLLDGAPIPPERGARDVRRDGGEPCVPLDGPRSYDFYAGPVEEHLLELRVPPGFSLFTFAFSRDGRS